MDAGSALSQTQGTDIGSLLSQEKSELAPMEQQLQTTANQNPQQPTLQKAPQAPEMEMGKDAMAWVGTLNVLAGLGGLRARQGATTALSAFGSGLNGFKEGKLDAFKQAQEQWKDANQSVIENNKAQVQAYTEALKDKKMSIDEQMANIKLIATQYHNDIMSQLAEQRNYTAVARVLDMMQKHQDDLQEKMGTLDNKLGDVNGVIDATQKAAQDYAQQYIDPQTKQLKPGAPPMQDFMKKAVQDYQGSHKGGVGGYSDEAIDRFADGLHEGLKPSDMGLSARTTNNPVLKAAMNRWAEKYPDDDVAKAQLAFAGEKSGATAVGRQSGQIQLASNILDQSIPSMIESAKKVGLTASTDLNTVLNTLKAHGSDQDLANFRTQLRAVTTDYAQFIGRGRQTVHSDEEALKILSDNGGITSLQGFADAVKTEQQNVQRGITKTQGGDTGGGSGATHKYNPETGQLE
jgi:hypothetical protein